ncbi:MAG: protein kinase [Planctomycetes bacterium]|nr:protein kinase [Planctomycetota bacterium]
MSGFRSCLRCGATLAEGADRCPEGHIVAGTAADTGSSSFLYSNNALFVPPADGGGLVQGPPNALFECASCQRLVETQRHRGCDIVPRFCPWCGKPVESIIGRELDGYRIHDVIAHGGFGMVCLACNVTEPQMKAVVKLLWPNMTYLRPELVKVLVEEARLTEEIGQKCWNVVRVFNVREKPWPYYFMEYIPGRTLDAVIRAAGTGGLPIDDCVGYMRGVAKGLAATHAARRVHRDLKPLNIMVIEGDGISNPEERVKLLDFGLAMEVASTQTGAGAGDGEDGATTAARPPASPLQSAGTPEYMPPEAFDGAADYSCDVYAFGVTAFEILTGQSPWEPPKRGGDRYTYWKDAHQKKPPRPVREVRPDVPGWLARVVMDCLEKDPARRLSSTEEIAERLRKPLPRWVWGAVAAAVMVVGVLVWLAIRGGGKELDGHWLVDGKEERGTWPVWVQSVQDLPNKTLEAAVSGDKPVLEASSPSKAVACEVQENGRVVVSFLEGPTLESLLESKTPVTITIEGSGDGFRTEWKIRVGLDTDPPVLEEPRVLVLPNDPFDDAKPLKFGARIHPRSHLAVRFDENKLSSVTLDRHDDHNKPPQSQWESVEAARPPRTGEQIWKVPLARLPSRGDEALHGYINAVDEAGNPAEPKEVSFIVDGGVSVSLFSEDPRSLARGTAVYGVKVDEPLAEIRVHDPRSKKDVAFAVVEESGEAPSAVQTVQIARDLQQVGFRADGRPLEAGKYHLAVRLESITETTFELHAKDEALPENDLKLKPLTLRFRPPKPLDGGEIGLSLKLDDDSLPVEIVPPELKPRNPIKAPVVKALTVSCRPGRVHHATCSVNGVSGPEVWAEKDSIAFQRLELKTDPKKEQEDNKILLTLYDPLGRPLELRLSVPTDVRAPIITPHEKVTLTQPDGEAKKAKIELSLTSDEPLIEASCNVQDKLIVEKAKPEDARRIGFNLAALEFDEGSHPFRIVAVDLAGNETPELEHRVDVNTGHPNVVPSAKLGPGGRLVLDTNDFLFFASDGNGLDRTGARVTFAIDGRGQPFDVDNVLPEDGKSGLHRVSLSGLPEEATGTVTIRIKDELGTLHDNPWTYQFRRPRDHYKEFVDWKGIRWVKVSPPGGKKELYISRCEISNGQYLEAYRVRKVGRPAYWGENGRVPTYTVGGTRVPEKDFPVVGVMPRDAEAFGQWLGGARLPMWEEWRSAAWKRNNGLRYPWREEKAGAGKSYVNCLEAWHKSPSPIFKDHICDGTMVAGDGRRVPCRVVKVGFDPFGSRTAQVLSQLNYSGEILHLIGNVGELVAMGGGAYAIAGGNTYTPYGAINLNLPSEQSETRKTFDDKPDSMTGFRLVIDLEYAPQEFVALAKEVAVDAGGR